MLRTERDKFFDGVGVSPAHLREGLRVMVPVGTVATVVNGGSSLVALAVCRGAAERDDWWWFDVFMGPGVSPLSQQYPVEQILGLPAAGLVMQDAAGDVEASALERLNRLADLVAEARRDGIYEHDDQWDPIDELLRELRPPAALTAPPADRPAGN